MRRDIEIIEKGIKSLIYNIDYNMFYIENGLWLKFKSGDIKIKYDTDFGWVSYIEEYNKLLESEIDNIHNNLNDYLYKVNYQ